MSLTSSQPSLFGDDLRDLGMALALHAVPDWKVLARRAALAIGLRQAYFTSEDVTALVGLPKTDIGKDANNAVGAAVRAWCLEGIVEVHDFVKAKNRQAHSARIGRYYLTERGTVIARREADV